MRRIIAFLILCVVKSLTLIFFKSRFKWLNPYPESIWEQTRLIVFLNHTSLYEPLFINAFPYRFLWHLAGHLNIPAADITLNRPVVGTFWKLMVPNLSSITRKKDSSWQKYLDTIDENSLIIIAPEGRMKRPNGLDKSGKPMSIRGGVTDIIERQQTGAMVICFSGGLHHVQSPGDHLPHLFKTINMNLSYHDIKSYKALFEGSAREKKIAMIRDLEQRLKRDCPDETLNR